MAKFIAIDGLDGCGKATQSELLRKELEKRGKRVVSISFPDYEDDSSVPVKIYLSGQLGTDASELNPYMCGSFYSIDRFIQYTKNLKPYFDEDDNTVIISDRYLSGNIIHQCGKLDNEDERIKYIDWCYDFECNLCGMPREDITICLSMLPEVSQKLLSDRYNGDESKKDIHECNVEYLTNCYNRLQSSIEYINSGKSKAQPWVSINCYDASRQKVYSRETIHNYIMSIVDKVLNDEEIMSSELSCTSISNDYFENEV